MTPLSVALRKRLRQLRGDDGFGLVELMVAFVILNVAVLGMAAAAGTTLRSLGTSKDRQSAVTLATTALEAARSLPYEELQMSGATFTTYSPSTATTGCSTSLTNVPSDCELVVTTPSGVIAPATAPYRFTQGSLTVDTVVTWVCAAPETQAGQPVVVGKCSNDVLTNSASEDTSRYSKRVTVVVTSSTSPTMKVRQSTLVSDAVRGLAGSQFSVFPSAGDLLSAPNLDETCFAHNIKNSGSNDSYEVVFPTTAGYDYTAYEDLGTRGVKDAADQQLLDLTGNTYPNTHPLATGETLYILLCYQPTSTPVDGSTIPMQTVVRSGYDPTVERTVTHTLVYATQLDLYLAHMNDLLNQGNPQVERGGVFEFKVAQPDVVTLTDYDTDGKIGKFVKRGDDDITNAGHMEYAVAFERKFSRPTEFSDTAQLAIWTSSKEAVDKFHSGSGTSAKGLVFKYRLRKLDENGAVLVDSGWIPDGYTHDFRYSNQAQYPLFVQRTVALPTGATGAYTFDAGDRMQLLVHCSKNAWKPPGQEFKAEQDCVLAYDTTSYPAYLRVGLQ